MVHRIAVCGPPGSGKSSFRRMSAMIAIERGFTLHHLRLADPLYWAQADVYRRAGRQLENPDMQDGRLLNVLGSEMRRINPEVLADHARETVGRLQRRIELSPSQPHVILCDDMRPADAWFLEELGFRFVGVKVAAGVSSARRRLRGDLSLGALDDVTERGFDELPLMDSIDNDGSLADLKVCVEEFWQKVIRDSDR